MITLNPATHKFSGCSCGHIEHVGRGMSILSAIECPACSEMATRENVLLAIETAARIETLSLAVGQPVRCNGKLYRIVSIVEITKLNGAIKTGCFLVKLKPQPKDS